MTVECSPSPGGTLASQHLEGRSSIRSLKPTYGRDSVSKTNKQGAKEIARKLTARLLMEDPSLVPSPHTRLLTSTCNTSFWEIQCFWPPGAPSCICTYPNTHTYTELKFIKLSLNK